MVSIEYWVLVRPTIASKSARIRVSCPKTVEDKLYPSTSVCKLEMVIPLIPRLSRFGPEEGLRISRHSKIVIDIVTIDSRCDFHIDLTAFLGALITTSCTRMHFIRPSEVYSICQRISNAFQDWDVRHSRGRRRQGRIINTWWCEEKKANNGRFKTC